ncbi:MAG: hypothetical protein EZS28_013540 [Streblomastix strix]|uniref:Uncharacterized protein n=1 Tax=Streblomastix strix TaxID=222440 RepID=A0A5J4W8V4_9EUKA|nr:MAG: hypothetical protein EZS28_013540 [Streblomastix strix]
MQSYQQIQIATNTIISFTDSFTKNKEIKQNEQYESDSESSLTEISSSLKSLINQILDNNTHKYVIIKTPKLLQSLHALSLYKISTHIDLDVDNQRFSIRSSSRRCLRLIQIYGDEQVQSELVNQGFGRVMSISFCNAGGICEEQDQEIYYGLNNISGFLRDLHVGRNDYYSSFKQLPLLARRTVEQIEEEGANEELEAQMNNKGNRWSIKSTTNQAKAAILNFFIHIN